MTATFSVIPSAKLQDVAAMLRGLADNIDAGKYGDVSEAAVVILGDELRVFGYGRADGPATHYLLCCGAERLRLPMLRPFLGG